MGRPRNNPHAAKTGSISCRVDPEIAAMLKASAEENGRSITAELEHRLAGTLPKDRDCVKHSLEKQERFLLARLKEVRKAISSTDAALRLREETLRRRKLDADRKRHAYHAQKAIAGHAGGA